MSFAVRWNPDMSLKRRSIAVSSKIKLWGEFEMKSQTQTPSCDPRTNSELVLSISRVLRLNLNHWIGELKKSILVVSKYRSRGTNVETNVLSDLLFGRGQNDKKYPTLQPSFQSTFEHDFWTIIRKNNHYKNNTNTNEWRIKYSNNYTGCNRSSNC